MADPIKSTTAGAGTGAGIGTAIAPGIGTAIGAGAGAGLGLLGYFLYGRPTEEREKALLALREQMAPFTNARPGEDAYSKLQATRANVLRDVIEGAQQGPKAFQEIVPQLQALGMLESKDAKTPETEAVTAKGEKLAQQVIPSTKVVVQQRSPAGKGEYIDIPELRRAHNIWGGLQYDR